MAECGLDNANKSLLHWDEAIQAKFNGQGKPYRKSDFEKMLWRYDVSYRRRRVNPVMLSASR